MASPGSLVAIATVALASNAGCSFLFVEGPPREHASSDYFDCTSSRLAPGADATISAVAMLATLGASTDQSSQDLGGVTTGVSIAAAAAVSSVYGYVKVDRCRKAKAALAERIQLERRRMPYPRFAAGVWPPGAPPAGAPPGAPPGTDPWLLAGPAPPLPTLPPPPATAAPAPAGPPPPPAPAPAGQPLPQPQPQPQPQRALEGGTP